MGEVRKRKVSAEDKNGKNSPEAQIIHQGGGLGLIPVVLIAAILAGSGCHVIKKDTAQGIAELNSFIDELKVKNSETIELVTTLRAAVVQKDAMIENLGKSLKATEEQAVALTDELNKLSDKIDETDEKIKDEVTVKYNDNMHSIRSLGKKVQEASETALKANNKMDDTDAKMEEIKTNLINAEEASKTRTEKISELEGKLENAKAEADEKLNKINSAIGSLPTGLQEDLIKQGSEILTVVSKLEALEERVTEVLDSLTKVENE